MMQPLLVGEACNLASGVAFGGRAGSLLADCLGVKRCRLLEAFECVNLLARWPGRGLGSKGHLFPLDEAKAGAAVLDLRGRAVVLAGRRVASAFGRRDAEFLEPLVLGRGEAWCRAVPAPSGIVRWYNRTCNRDAAGAVLREALKLCASCG